MDEVRLAGAMAGLAPDAAERARELIAGLVEEKQLIARAEGRNATILAELAQLADEEGADAPGSNGPEYARRAMAADVAAATRTHPSAAKNRMEDAAILVSDFPTTHAALSEGGSRSVTPTSSPTPASLSTPALERRSMRTSWPGLRGDPHAAGGGEDREGAVRGTRTRERRERSRENDERRRAEYERAAEAARLKRYAEEAASYQAEAQDLEDEYAAEREFMEAVMSGEITPPEYRAAELTST